ncbi:MAG: hypothetical protein COB51_00585 [Moraxellaceae bacterium]|nr:MAG: hypothetical protein COB51_00585 [Moraxellaceae bacterium]
MMCLKSFAVVVITLCAVSNACYALSVKSKTFDQLVLESDEVIQGRVVSIESRFGEGSLSHHIFTYIEFNELKIIDETDNQVDGSYQLRIVGGRVGNVIQAFPGLPSFDVGQNYVLFVRGNGHELFPLVGVYQGVYKVVSDDQGDEVIREVGDHQQILRSVAEYRAAQKQGSIVGRDIATSQRSEESLKADEFMTLIRQRWQQLRPHPLFPQSQGNH